MVPSTATQQSALPAGEEGSKEVKGSDGSDDATAGTTHSETSDQKRKRPAKTVTFNTKSEILHFDHDLDLLDPYFDPSDRKKIDTKTEDGKFSPFAHFYKLSEEDRKLITRTPISKLTDLYQVEQVEDEDEDEDEDEVEVEASLYSVESQPQVDRSAASAASSPSLAAQTEASLSSPAVASSSRQTLECGAQPAPTVLSREAETRVFTNTDQSSSAVNKTMTDLDLLSAINALKSNGLIPSSFNLFGLTSTDSNVDAPTDTTNSMISETETLNNTTSDLPSDSTSDLHSDLPSDFTSGSAAEGSEPLLNKKRSRPSDQEESELPLKRKKLE
jgi:hypothetical protein